MSLDLVVVGSTGGTHIGGSLARAARELRLSVEMLDTSQAFRAPALVRRFCWHLRDKRPPNMRSFQHKVYDLVRHRKPRYLLATGSAALTKPLLASIADAGVVRINYATDDPFNPSHRCQWHLDALPEYDLVASPRKSNLEDLNRQKCRRIRYVAFAFDPHLLARLADEPAGDVSTNSDVVFIGGADADRVEFFREFAMSVPALKLFGGYWERYPELAGHAQGFLSPRQSNDMTRRSGVNICLVRRANRDGHVMRSYEIPAMGGFMLAEKTDEHVDIFGEEGRCVLYFSSPGEAAQKATWALANPAERKRMANAARAHIVGGHNTYADRLQEMLG